MAYAEIPKGNVNVAMQLIAQFAAENNFMTDPKHRGEMMFLGIGR